MSYILKIEIDVSRLGEKRPERVGAILKELGKQMERSGGANNGRSFIDYGGATVGRWYMDDESNTFPPPSPKIPHTSDVDLF